MTQTNTQNSLNSLLKIMQALRAPNGCPWDAAQTPESLTPYILEEACELIDAIELGAAEPVLDELGDLLLQVVFLAQIFSERKQFDFNDVVTVIANKLIRRHPHVFDHDYRAGGDAELDQQWEEIKRSESTYNKACLADHLPEKLPALQRAQKLVSRADRTSRKADLPNVDTKILESIMNTDEGKARRLDEEVLGLILFQLVRLAHDANLDAEASLRKMTRQVMHHLEQE